MYKKTDILFIPPISKPVFTEDYENFMPLGILTLCANLIQHDLKGDVYIPKHRLFDNNSFDEAASEIIKMNIPLVGFSTYCHSFSASVILAQKIKLKNPSITILFGGPHATLLSKEILQEFKFVDFVLKGEADLSIVAFLKYHNSKSKNIEHLKNISGLIFRFKGNIYDNDYSIEDLDLNLLPIPKYDLINISNSANIDVGRGCPFSCTFCCTNGFFSKKYRVKSKEKLIKEIDFLYSNFNVQSFSFAHDMFTLNHNFINSFCDIIQLYQNDNEVKFKWSCSARIDCISDSLLENMANAGCVAIFFGVETGSQNMQKIINKKLKLNSVIKVLKKCIDVNIKPTAAFMGGFPKETRNDLNDTLRLMLECSVIGAKVQFSVLSIMPGSSLFDNNINYLEYDGNASDFSGSILSNEEIELIQKYPRFFSSFYYLPVPNIQYFGKF